MFEDALERAQESLVPIVISRRTADKKCTSVIGSAVLLNRSGWILSASHVLNILAELDVAQIARQLRDRRAAAINSDPKLDQRAKTAALKSLGRDKPTDVTAWSAWFGIEGQSTVVRAEQVIAMPPADVAVAKLTPFDPSMIKRLPVINSGAKVRPGARVCRLGFAFHSIVPIYNEPTNSFELPAGSVPLPIFPNEGIIARQHTLIPTGEDGTAREVPFPLRMFETSSPGIRGQSGGPIINAEGEILGIQSSTMSYEMDLRTPVKQYVHVGVGVHAETICGFLRHHGIEYHQS